MNNPARYYLACKLARKLSYPADRIYMLPSQELAGLADALLKPDELSKVESDYINRVLNKVEVI